MPGAAANDLLRSCSWHAEKQFRKRGNFPSVIWLTEDPTGHRQLFETGCDAPKSVASDAQVLAALAEEMRADFAKAGVVRFCVAYLANRVTVIRPLDPDAAMKPKTTKRSGIVIELHSPTEHLSIFREIIKPLGGKPILAAADELEADTRGSPYINLLNPQACTAAMDQILGEQQ